MFHKAHFKLNEVLALHLVKERPLFTLCSDQTCQEAMELFQEHDFLAAPLNDESTGLFICFIEISDLILYCLEMLRKSERDSFNMEAEKVFLERFLKVRLRTIYEHMKETKRLDLESRVINPTTPLMKMMESCWKEGVMRFACVNEANKIVNMITQTDILVFLAENEPLLQKRQNIKLLTANLLRPLVRVRFDATTLMVLRLLIRENLYAVPIIDLDGKFLATFSRTDMKYFRPEDVERLWEPVGEYLKNRTRILGERFPAAKFKEQRLNQCLDPVTCNYDDTLDFAMKKMLMKKIHRLWIIDDKRIPIGVVTEADIMRGLIEPFEHVQLLQYQ